MSDNAKGKNEENKMSSTENECSYKDANEILKRKGRELMLELQKKELLLSKAQDRISELESSPAFSNVVCRFTEIIKGENMRSLEEYLDDNAKEGIIDFAFRAEKIHGGYQITVHPNGQGGETIDFFIENNSLVTTTDTKEQE